MPQEESKASLTIANVRSGLFSTQDTPITAPLIIDKSIPPTYVSNRIRAHEHAQAVVFNPQGNRIASAGSDGIVKLWKTNL